MTGYTLSSKEIEKYKLELNVPNNHNLRQISFKWEQRKGEDTDIFELDELDKNNRVIARYMVRSSTSIYPPFTHSLSWEKI